ncbi:ABC transporter permease [Staphylococcus saccharolyticus]|uniref:Ferrichrome ABC transporter permease n=1 Tax=Staphylococcus saccharolyticus TaxID=33028 RepID=A0A380H728_9STAP|nr:iron chelate uptake ABC transporter family permease subunit [Staphylococcus saccharolyticus]MBL7565748.1 iron chelate uptake ABC transporter family permease subunit [Staphylococcus saccharolyticus]MBL7572170.1 iron chelate uptake ABC transporter family permease subunit [Staphylococcus saccharolyticus]QQB97725.1 iron chelate uptake ABC transporter family permease subunit [Staphylococcus saccharolyticus]QRJ66419.1 iron chelate uptake ABC transporter family permease subunit [Staphylococcus sacc
MKFIFKGYALFILLVILIVVSLFIGVSQLSILDIFLLNDEQKNILFSSGIPRTVSILLSGSLLALAGLIMQQMMQNKFVSPTTAGTIEWAKLGILMSLLFFPNGHILIKLLFAVALGIIGTFLFVRLINLIRVKEVIFVPLLGIMIGGIVSSFTTFVALRTNALQSIGNWLTGNFAIITSSRYEVLYLTISLLILAFIFANHFTIAGMGKDFSHNLGVSYEKIINIALFITAMLTALVVVTVGTLPFLGLIVPNIISIYRGDHLKNTLPHMFGTIFVLIADIIGRIIVYPYEINIGLTIGVFGTIIFLILLMKGRKNYANEL